MTDNAQDLARRAVACPGWRWMPGMLGQDQSDGATWTCLGRAILAGGRESTRFRWAEPGGAICRDTEVDMLPDLTDPATLGCLLALVREAWGMPTGITVAYSDDTGRWVVSWSGGTHGGVCGEGATEAAALVAALEAAP